MKRTARALLLLALWLAALAAFGAYTARTLTIGTDLRLFLPTPTTAEQRLLLEGMGEGPASRMLAIALEGAPAERLAEVSQALVEKLQSNTHFRFVTNGNVALDAVAEDLLQHRFALSPALDARALDRDYLRAQIEQRARDLATPAGFALESLLARDPTLVLLDVAERWQPLHEPRRELDVWFDRAGRRALLVAETRAAAFDYESQRTALAALADAHAAVRGADTTTMTVSGAGTFSVDVAARTRAAAEALGSAAGLGMIVLLLLAYRRIGSVVLSTLPIASAALAGLAAVSAVFGTVHGITLAFGFTLIGVAQDYPIHLLSHCRAGVPPSQTARRLWPTLATGVASTCIAYGTFFFAGVSGLAQLATFTVTGLAVAAVTTRFVLPALIDAPRRDHADSPLLARLSAALRTLPRPTWAAAVLIVAAGALIWLAPQRFWQDELDALTPIPAELVEIDRELRAELGTPDLRYLLAVQAPSADAALEQLEELEPALDELVAEGTISGFDHAARYVPSVSTQRGRQERLPDAPTLRAELAAAVAASPFRPDAFEPFVEDVQRARTLAPVTADFARSTALGSRLELLLRETAAGVTALVTFSGLANPAALAELATPDGTVKLLDMRAESAALMARQRANVLGSLAIAAALLVAVVGVALRRPSRVARVLAPMALTTLLVVAVLQTAGISLNLFHLISLILCAGLGLDYALFFEHAAGDAAEQRRTLHAVLVCAVSTLLVFAVLALSSLPVLRAIGLPVAIGVASNFVLALLLTRQSSAVTAPQG